jgi:FixJ family two-component response regulator
VEAKPIVCIIDDDGSVRQIARRTLEVDGFEVRTYASADSFFAEYDAEVVDCVLTDLQMPEVSGEQLMQRLRELQSPVSVVVVTGHADVPTAVRLMEDGALTLLQKPYRPAELTAVTRRAVTRTQAVRAEKSALDGARLGLARLTDDERHVMDYMVKGLPNKAIAMRLDLSMRTVDRRRNAVLTKMNVGSVSELVAMVTKLEGHP